MFWRANINRIRYLSPRRLWIPPRSQHTNVKIQSPTESTPSLTEGSEVAGFNVTAVSSIPDFNCKLINLNHVDTGAQYTHIERNDSNNVFAIAFRTTPFDSTGLPHILEHITLMGSEKYPCRDPFFKMLNRSLATYINACTAPDYTVYPFATQNLVDYYNLMSVYLDAVFRPKLRENDFKLEGWRLEHEEVTDPNSPITFKGVVFNEMKGVFSENQNIFLQHFLNNILPSHTYGVNSGGDPLQIPHLTYEKLVDFQKNHYHPSNCRIYSYGSFNLVDHLKFINENYLKDYSFCESYPKSTVVPREKRWSEPKKVHVYGKNDPLAADSSKQSILAVSYLCEDIKNVYELFELKVLSQLLIDGPNASFYKALVEPNFGSGYSPGTGFDSQTRDTTFMVGLQGLSENDFDLVESTVYKTLDECIANGFEEKNIENILHGVELSMKHQGSDFGMNLLFSISPLWNHNGDCVELLRLMPQVLKFRKRLADDSFYLQRKVEEYFKNNPHRLVLAMTPDEQYEDRAKEAENRLLQQKLGQMSDLEKKNIYETGLTLKKILETKDDFSCLPMLKVSDISRDCKFPPVCVAAVEDVPLQVCSVPTNNITYFRALLNISELSDDAKCILPLFVQVVSQMGTKKYDYREFDQMIHRKTLGLNIGVHVADDIETPNVFEESVSLGSLCLDQNVDGMFELWSTLFTGVCLTDVNRFTTLVRNIASDLANGVADSGHHYAILNASARVTPAALRREQFGGLTFVQKMKEIAGSEDLSAVLAEMKNIAEVILNKKRMRCALNVSPEQQVAANESVRKFFSQIEGEYEGEIEKHRAPLGNSLANQTHFVLPFAVNYAAKSVSCVPFADPEFPALRVLCKLLTTKYLLPLVRERYGAYGAGASISACGAVQFYSYRDPNTVGTMNIFDESLQWLMKNEFSESDIDEAKLGVFREVDAPKAPSEHGMRLFMNGIDDRTFAEHRLRILEITRDDLLRAGTKYLYDSCASAKVLIGPDCKETEGWEKVYNE